MSQESSKQRYVNLLNSVGKQVVATLYPEDFEVYITSLELVDSQDKVVEYFLFPINASSISKSTSQIVNIKKTAGGISTTSTNTFMPSIISFSGNFGTKFKILLNAENIDFAAFSFSEQYNKSVSNFKSQVFSNTVKTGYGCNKILERIIQKSSQLDKDGQPYFLHLYNLSFGESFLVKTIGQPTFSCNIEKNMIWEYQFQLQTLAPLNQIENSNEQSNLKQLGFSAIQKGLTSILGNINSSISLSQNKTQAYSNSINLPRR